MKIVCNLNRYSYTKDYNRLSFKVNLVTLTALLSSWTVLPVCFWITKLIYDLWADGDQYSIYKSVLPQIVIFFFSTTNVTSCMK